jgi:hypothetical protein
LAESVILLAENAEAGAAYSANARAEAANCSAVVAADCLANLSRAEAMVAEFLHVTSAVAATVASTSPTL